MKYLLIFLILALEWKSIHGILEGDPAEWHRHGYVVKILAREKETGDHKQGCSGILVSPSIILTTKNCLISPKTNNVLEDIIVVLSWTEGKREKTKIVTKKRIGTFLAIQGAKAAIQISPLSITELCPKKNPRDPKMLYSSTSRVAILPIRPSLFRSAAWDDVHDFMTKCRIIGWDQNNTNFVENQAMLSMDIEDFPQSNGEVIVVPIDGNRTACWGDTGIPLECQGADTRAHRQFGLLTKLDSESSDVSCEWATSMRFTPLWDKDTMMLLQKYDLPGYVMAHGTCSANAYADEPLNE